MVYKTLVSPDRVNCQSPIKSFEVKISRFKSVSNRSEHLHTQGENKQRLTVYNMYPKIKTLHGWLNVIIEISLSPDLARLNAVQVKPHLKKLNIYINCTNTTIHNNTFREWNNPQAGPTEKLHPGPTVPCPNQEVKKPQIQHRRFCNAAQTKILWWPFKDRAPVELLFTVHFTFSTFPPLRP